MPGSTVAYVLHLSVVRLALLAILAALLVTEHIRFALAARRTPGRRQLALAWLVPGAGAVMAWRRGSRFGPTVYALLVLSYLVVRWG